MEKRIYTLALLLFFLCACKKKEEETNVDAITLDTTPYVLDFGNFPPPMIPQDNQLTQAKVQLGRMLFYDPILSGDGSQSCADCHRQKHAFSDTNTLSIGIAGLEGKRQAMGIFNMLWNSNEFFWDGRAHFLRDQALKPIQDPLEMNETLANVVAKLSASSAYKDQFMRAFGSTTVDTTKIALALEQFMFTLTSYQSKFDAVQAGLETFTASEQRGHDLFFTEYNAGFPDQSGADCAHCHGGFNFENDQYMNNGLDTDANMLDDGRMAVTNDANDKGKFKVTSLRNVSLTPPYMHDGRFNTLAEVVQHYNAGLQSSSTIDPALQNTMGTGLFLDAQDVTDLVNFLKTLEDRDLTTNPKFSSPF